ncbi:MAG: ROK family protein [Bacteroidales bacterium]|jgi:glucokinase
MNKVIALDLGGSHLTIALANQNNIITKNKYNINQFNVFNDVIDEIMSFYNKHNLNNEIIGIGIGAPNANYHTGCIHNAVNLPWKEVINVKKLLSQKFPHLINVIDNDANCAALGEKYYGSAKNIKDFLVITLGTGLGSGIYCNDKIVRGATGLAGELGHVILINNGRLCTCGRNGCVESYISTRGIFQTAIELATHYDNSSLFEYPQDKWTPKLIANLASANDMLSQSIFDKTAEYLALSLANYITLLEPSGIFLTGGISQAGDILLKPLCKYINQYILPFHANSFKIDKSSLPEQNAALLGVAALVWQEWQEKL